MYGIFTGLTITPAHIEKTYAELSEAANAVGFSLFSLAATMERPIRERAYRDFEMVIRQSQR